MRCKYAHFDAGVDPGLLIDAAALNKVQQLVDEAGGGHQHALGGTFFEPTVLTDVQSHMQTAREETFDPVAPLLKFTSEEEAIAIANDTTAGLASYIYSGDVGRAWRVAEQLEYGMVGIDSGVISSEVIPFGGVKESGLGREGSRYGMDEFVEMKYLSSGSLEA